MHTEEAEREALRRARRVVVKVGTRLLVRGDGRPSPARLRAIVRDVAAVHRAGREVVLVSSGAIGAGMEALGLDRRPRNLPDLQMAAAVGQTSLMARYSRLFAAQGCRVGQVLLTHDGLKARARHLNARNALLNLLRHRIVPVVNENDAVAVDEIRFGDNDRLAALVAILLDADLLVLLTTVDGLRAPAGRGRTRRVPSLASVTRRERDLVFGDRNELSTGGMASKLQSADLFARVGRPAVIADGRRRGIVGRVLEGEDTGTVIGALGRGRERDYRGRRRWIAFFHRSEGAVVVDDGARRALERGGKSLLPIGVREVEGDFAEGAVIDVRGRDGRVFARGLTGYGAADLRRIRGRKSGEVAGVLGACAYDEIIHRDNLVVFDADREEHA